MEYKRIILKLSGEALSNDGSIFSKDIFKNIVDQIKLLQSEFNIQVGIVVGGGNIFRGEISSQLGLGADTKWADYMGMLATSINALGLYTYFNENKLETIYQNSFDIEKIAPKINPKKAIEALEENKVVIFGGGTGEPYLSTDTAAALRAIDIKADAILMAKNNIDGIYDKDPNKDKNAKFIEKLTFEEVISKDLKVVDKEAMKILNNKKIDILLFGMNEKNSIIDLCLKPDYKKTIITN